MLKLARGVATEVQNLVSQGGHRGVWAVTYSLGGIVQRHIMGLPEQGVVLCGQSVMHQASILLLQQLPSLSSVVHHRHVMQLDHSVLQ